MLNILIATHGNLGEGLVHSYNMIAGDSSNIHTLKLTEIGIDDFKKRLVNKLTNLTSNGNKVLILCDIKGGTPYNESYMYSLENPEKIEIVSGVNLPMLIETGLISQNNDDIKILSEIATTVGKESIKKLSDSSVNNDLDL